MDRVATALHMVKTRVLDIVLSQLHKDMDLVVMETPNHLSPLMAAGSHSSSPSPLTPATPSSLQPVATREVAAPSHPATSSSRVVDMGSNQVGVMEVSRAAMEVNSNPVMGASRVRVAMAVSSQALMDSSSNQATASPRAMASSKHSIVVELVDIIRTLLPWAAEAMVEGLIRVAMEAKIEEGDVEDLVVVVVEEEQVALTAVEGAAVVAEAAWAVVNGEDSVNLVDHVKAADPPDMKWPNKTTLTTTQSLCKALEKMLQLSQLLTTSNKLESLRLTRRLGSL